MTLYNNHRPQDAPETIMTADEKTVLHRFRVEGVIFARNRSQALRRLELTNISMDAARLLEDEPEEPPRYGQTLSEISNALQDACADPADTLARIERAFADANKAVPRYERPRPPGWPEDDLLGQPVCAAHVPDYVPNGQYADAGDVPCAVCGEPSVIIVPSILPADHGEPEESLARRTATAIADANEAVARSRAQQVPADHGEPEHGHDSDGEVSA